MCVQHWIFRAASQAHRNADCLAYQRNVPGACRCWKGARGGHTRAYSCREVGPAVTGREMIKRTYLEVRSARPFEPPEMHELCWPSPRAQTALHIGANVHSRGASHSPLHCHKAAVTGIGTHPQRDVDDTLPQIAVRCALKETTDLQCN